MESKGPSRGLGFAVGIGLLGLTTLPAAVIMAPSGFWAPPQRWYDLALVVAAVGQAVFAGFVIASLRYARMSAEAATAALKHGQLTAERQLRAYVVVEDAWIELHELEGDRAPEVVIRFLNAGQTPARDFNRNFEVKLSLTEEAGIIATASIGFVTEANLGPGRDTLSWADLVEFPSDFTNALKRNTAELRVEVVATYLDIFDCRHTLTMSYILSGSRIIHDNKLRLLIFEDQVQH